MDDITKDIQEIVNRETKAWDTQDVELLMTIFHPDMVWPWPPHPKAHDPMDWILEQGRFDHERWKRGWQELFDTHTLIHNKREIRRIAVSEQGDGAFAVVDIDTLWVSPEGMKNHWKGRVCKVYTKISHEWKLIMHTGVLEYGKSPDD
jgi:ketosteroid isomerase-like protein